MVRMGEPIDIMQKRRSFYVPPQFKPGGLSKNPTSSNIKQNSTQSKPTRQPSSSALPIQPNSAPPSPSSSPSRSSPLSSSPGASSRSGSLSSSPGTPRNGPISLPSSPRTIPTANNSHQSRLNSRNGTYPPPNNSPNSALIPFSLQQAHASVSPPSYSVVYSTSPQSNSPNSSPNPTSPTAGVPPITPPSPQHSSKNRQRSLANALPAASISAPGDLQCSTGIIDLRRTPVVEERFVYFC